MDGNFVNLAHINPSKLVAVKNGTKGHWICSSNSVSSSTSISSVCISLVRWSPVISSIQLQLVVAKSSSRFQDCIIHWQMSAFKPAAVSSLVPEGCKHLFEMVYWHLGPDQRSQVIIFFLYINIWLIYTVSQLCQALEVATWCLQSNPKSIRPLTSQKHMTG